METIEQAFENLASVKSSLYLFAAQYEICHVYDSNSTATALNAGPYEMLLGIGLSKQYEGSNAVKLKQAEKTKAWVFLCLGYGSIENKGNYGFVFEPQVVIQIRKQEMKLRIINNGIDPDAFQYFLRNFRDFNEIVPSRAPVAVHFEAKTDKQRYLNQVEQIRQDIYNGKYYEMNYCIEFISALQHIDVLPYFMKLNEASKAPFAAFAKHPENVLLCSSPERFLLKEANYLLSQPIKGTNKSLPGKANEAQLNSLKQSEKERAENVMIVDLVRNDLAKICKTGSIRVEELYGAYAYTSVNHLVSSVSGILNPNQSLGQVFDALYPMGSMTGAPKIEVMKHIDAYESGERGIYSGSLGYISPDKDFDFNVIIRTLVYNYQKSEISYKVGSAITYDSSAEQEYEECVLKGSRMASVFEI